MKNTIKLIAKKIGMTSAFDEEKEVEVPITAIELKNFTCIEEQKDNEVFVYKLGFDQIQEKDLRKFNKSYKNSFREEKPFKFIKQLRLNSSLFEKGKEYNAHEFLKDIAKVDIKGISKGHGFTGVMKRHNFKGLGRSHGVSVTHRSQGSIGTRRKPTKVLKGKKMPGRWGGDNITIKKLSIVKVLENNILAIKGSIPGCKGSVCQIIFEIK